MTQPFVAALDGSTATLPSGAPADLPGPAAPRTVSAPAPIPWPVASPSALPAVRPWALPVAVVAFALLTALGARVAVPLGVTPVPMTLQTLFVMLSGALLGPTAGASSQLLYLGLGFAGVPVFAMGGAGLPWILGPTGGYLMSFPAAAAVTGWVAGDKGQPLRTATAFAAGSLVIFAMGAGWLSVVTSMTGAALVAAAVVPFLPGAVVKAGMGWVVVRSLVGSAGWIRGRGA